MHLSAAQLLSFSMHTLSPIPVNSKLTDWWHNIEFIHHVSGGVRYIHLSETKNLRTYDSGRAGQQDNTIHCSERSIYKQRAMKLCIADRWLVLLFQSCRSLDPFSKFQENPSVLYWQTENINLL